MTRSLRWIASAAVLLFVVAAAEARFREDDPSNVLEQGLDLLAARRPAEAYEVLGRVTGDRVSDPVAKEAAVVRIHAANAAKRPADAAKLGLDLLSVWPADEPWRGRVEGLLAKAAELSGDVRDAAAREEALAARLLSDGEKARVAGVYLAWAERFGKGEPAPDAVRPGIPPDHERAMFAYRRALEVLGPKADRTGPLLAIARHALAIGNASEAVRASTEALTAWKAPGPNEAGTRPAVAPAWVAEAHLRRAEGFVRWGRPGDARGALRTLLALPSVLESGFAPEAWILLGRTYMGDAAAGALAQAKDAFATYLKTWPDGSDAPKVRRLVAEACLAVGAFDEALPALAAVIDGPKAGVDDQAWARMAKAGVLRSLRRYDDARAAVLEFLAQHSSHADVPNAQSLLPALQLDKAKAAFEERRREDGLAAYAAFVDQWPLDQRAPQISLEIGHELRKAAEFVRARDAYRAARERWRTARPDVAATAGLWQGVVEEEDRRDLEAAAAAYRDVVEEFGGQPAAREAAARLFKLEGIELALSSLRVFGAHETATVELAVRNVKETTFRLYRLDAAGYYERKGTLSGAEGLDVALVKADHTWTHATPEFARYRSDRLTVALKAGDAPLGEGAYLVSAEAERRRAVVLVLVSKIRVVVKHAPTEVFAWATDAATGAPVADAEIFVRGSGLKASAKTGTDGVARIAVTPESGKCDVIARLGASVAPGLAEAPGRRTTEQLTPRAHWTFDRPVYRPSDDVRFAVVVRDVDDGAFVTPDKQPVEIAWIDPRGRTVASTVLTTGAFGEADGAFQTPADGAMGDWTLRATLRPGTNRERRFEERVVVRQYRKPEFKISVRPAKADVLPGERVEIGLSVDSFFGGAAPRADFQWRVFRRPATFDASRYRDAAWFYKATEKTKDDAPDATFEFVAEGGGSTDVDGRATFTFETESLVAPQQYLVQASVMDVSKQWTTGTGSVFSSWTPGNVVVLPDRRAYRSGDRVTARVVAVAWNGAPLPAKGKVELLSVRTEGGRTIEEATSSATVDLGLSGEAEVRLEASRAGRVVVRFTGENATGLKVVGEGAADVAGERPDLAKEAKLVFERDVYRAGERARAFLNVPNAPMTTLLTFEAESVLMYRVVVVTEKASILEVEIPELLAPNCVASIAAPGAEGLLTSDDPLVVLRHLDVEVTADREVARPGERVKFTITTKDQSGRPTPAAVALTLADAALEGLGGVGVQDPRFVFNRDARSHLVRTGSSFAFKQSATARPLDADLVALDEMADRLKASSAIEELARKQGVRPGRMLEDAKKLKAESPAEAEEDASDEPIMDSGGGAIGLGGGEGGAFGGRRGGRRELRAAGGGGVSPPAASPKPARAPSDKNNSEDFDFQSRSGWEEGNVDRLAVAQIESAGRVEERLRQLSSLSKSADLRANLLSLEPNSPFGGGESGYFARHDGTYGGPGGVFGGVALQAFVPAPVEMRENLVDVALWAPSLTTGADGRVEIETTLPDNLTRWSATAAGVNSGVAAGLGNASLKVRKEVLVRVSLPPYASTGDEFSAVVIGQHVRDETLRVKLTLRAEDAHLAVVEGASEVEREIGPRGTASFGVKIKTSSSGLARFEAQALSGVASDGLKQGVRVLPFGEPWRVAERRTVRDRGAFSFEIPAGLLPGTVSARVVVQTGLAAELLEGLAFLGGYPHASLDATLNRVAAAAVVHRAFVEANLPSPVSEKELKASCERLWTTLRGFQNADGGFGAWAGRPSEPDPTAFALDALTTLRDAGYTPGGDLFGTAIMGAANALQQLKGSRDQRAALVAALVRSGVDRSGDLNALYRERDQLSTPALAKLLRAACLGGRGALTGELLEALRRRRVETSGDAVLPFKGLDRDPWRGSDQETTALVLLAYQAADARLDERASLAQALRRRWRLFGCVHTRATATTASALSRFVREDAAIASEGEVVVALDGKELPARRLSGASPLFVFEFDAAALTPGKHEAVVTRSGGGEADVRLAATGVVPAVSVDAAEGFFDVSRRVVPFQDPDRPSSAFAEGFDIVEKAKRPPYAPPVPLAQAVSGSRVTVRLSVKAREDAHYVVVEDPLPAGFDVVEDGVRGPHTRFERRADRMVFVFDRLRQGEEAVVTYPVYATLSGRYRALPAEASEMYATELRGRSNSVAFEIVEDPRLLLRVEPLKPTPDARLSEARKAFAEENYARVLDLIGTLGAEFALVNASEDEVGSMVLRAALRLGRAAEAVKARDALLARNPAKAAVDPEDALRLGSAYNAVGDPERGREQFQNIADFAYGVEAHSALFLSELGRPTDAAALTTTLLRRLPARGGVPEAEYRLADALLGLDDPAVKAASARPMQQKRWAAALGQYRRTAAWYAGTMLAERADMARVRVLVAVGLPAAVLAEARTFAERHPRSATADEALATEAEAAFTLGKYDEAKKPAGLVRSSLFYARPNDPTPLRKSGYAWAAAYLLGKIAHVEGRLDEAVKLYGEASEDVPDAAESHRFFTERELSVEPVVRVRAGPGAKLPIRVKNVAKATVQLYPVDLGVLFATRKSFSELNKADLSGIAPQMAAEFVTGVAPYAAAEFLVPLTVGGGATPASLATGAYLAVVTDGERVVSAVVLAGDLELTVQRGGATALRCYLTDGRGTPVAKARVTVGQAGAVWYAGETDERGMLLVDLRSADKATVVAEKGDRYAAAER